MLNPVYNLAALESKGVVKAYIPRKRFRWLFGDYRHVGYVSVDKEQERNQYFAFLTNGRISHHLLNSPAYGVNFRISDGKRNKGVLGWTGVYESAISLLPVRKDEQKAQEIEDYMVEVLRTTVQKHQLRG